MRHPESGGRSAGPGRGSAAARAAVSGEPELDDGKGAPPGGAAGAGAVVTRERDDSESERPGGTFAGNLRYQNTFDTDFRSSTIQFTSVSICSILLSSDPRSGRLSYSIFSPASGAGPAQ